jgi:AraC-like DNA-binding protein
VLYVTRRPAAPLDQAIAHLWYCRNAPGPRRLERVLPTGGAQLIINLQEDQTRTYAIGRMGRPECQATSGSILSGVATRYQIIDSAEQEHVVGVFFHPGGTRPLFAESAHQLQDRDVPLDALWTAGETARLREELLAAPTAEAALDVLEAALRRAWRVARLVHPAVAYALGEFRRLADVARVAAVTDRIGMSARRFAERFEAEVGVTPKRYCRLLRFQDAVRRAHAGGAPGWAELAVSSGYYDQAHFIHDFQAFSGLTPTAYQAGRTAFANHVTFLQSDGR